MLISRPQTARIHLRINYFKNFYLPSMVYIKINLLLTAVQWGILPLSICKKTKNNVSYI